MRLFRVTEDDKYEEIDPDGGRLHNLDDAVTIAKDKAGDGGFAVDMENGGKVVIFRLNEGNLQFNPNTDRLKVERHLAPAYVYDQEHPRVDPAYDSLGVGEDFPVEERQPVTTNAYEEHED